MILIIKRLAFAFFVCACVLILGNLLSGHQSTQSLCSFDMLLPPYCWFLSSGVNGRSYIGVE